MPVVPVVSVVIPVHNQAGYVREAVESVLGQGFRERELILIDDASTDDSWEAIHPYGVLDGVSLHRNERNLDCAATFNRGFRLSRGRYVAILAADDAWRPDFLERCVGALESHPEAAFAYTRVNLIGPDGVRRPRRRDRIPHHGDRCGDDFGLILCNLNPVPHHATVVRRSCLEEAGGYDESLVTTHDWDLWLRLSSRWPVAFLDSYLADYRVHEANVSLRRSSRGEKERFIISLLDHWFDSGELPEHIQREKPKVYARAWLDIAEGYRAVGEITRMREAFRRALGYSRNPALYAPYRRLLLELVTGAVGRLHRSGMSI